jgi:hypothetical protein
VYAGSLFGGPATIDAVTFYASSDAGVNADGTYLHSLSTTSAPVNGLDSNMAKNVGPDFDTFFSGTLPAYVAGATLTFTLSTPFSFDPSKGNLLLDVLLSGVTDFSGAPYVSQNGDFGTDSSRMVNGSATRTSGSGLMTTFASGSAVPEPSTLALCGLGAVALAGYAGRRRSRPTPCCGTRS